MALRHRGSTGQRPSSATCPIRQVDGRLDRFFPCFFPCFFCIHFSVGVIALSGLFVLIRPSGSSFVVILFVRLHLAAASATARLWNQQDALECVLRAESCAPEQGESTTGAGP
jgi:hypothetical protein